MLCLPKKKGASNCNDKHHEHGMQIETFNTLTEIQYFTRNMTSAPFSSANQIATVKRIPVPEIANQQQCELGLHIYQQ
jgi:hypothetical protein